MMINNELLLQMNFENLRAFPFDLVNGRVPKQL